MALDIVRGKNTNPIATEELVKILKKHADAGYEETLYLGYPLASFESIVTIDALFISERYGLVAFIFPELGKHVELNDIIEKQGELYFQLTNALTQYLNLRKGRSLAFHPNVISIIPNYENIQIDEIEPGYVLSTFEELPGTINTKASEFDGAYYRALVESLQKVSSIKPRKKRKNVKKSDSKGNILKKIEKEIANLDKWQNKATLEKVDGPQRIRGLAGSGKTVVLALKAAYLHVEYPEWEIVITYYTRSLWQQYKDFITKFVLEIRKEEPDWDKIHLLHAWGSQSEPGLYSEIARSINQIPMNYMNARLKFGNQNPFSGICDELNQILSDDKVPLYDLLLIDEAQDMPASFFKLAYKSVRDPKRIIWAYDELQNLNNSVMPSIEEMFGTDATGRPLVNLNNEADAPMQDIILPVCYRNTPWALALAHSLGFGIYPTFPNL